MPLRVYNTLSRTKEDFDPINAGKVGMYLCGPTVYKPSHIGHAVGPIIFDAIKRYLTFRGFEVTWVVNITDVEDKLIAEAQKEGCGTYELAERVTRNYLEAMDKLGIAQGVNGIDHMPKASEHIGDIIKYIERLIAKEAAYPLDGDVYFDVTADDDYGKLSNRSPEEQASQRELQSGAKRHPGDFALWKASKPDEPEDVSFQSPWGRGRPGWHIECSAMSMRYLGESFDIHGGGLDLVFPHHENEIAQSESATGKPFAKYWLHHGLTRFNTKKISKSDPEMQAALERMVLSNLLETYSGELLRYFILSTHYRRPIEFSPEEIEGKRKGLNTFYRRFDRVERITGRSTYQVAGPPGGSEANAGGAASLDQELGDYRDRFLDAMDDDFNTAAAIAVLFEMAGRVNRYIDETGMERNATDEGRETALNAAGRLIGLARLLGLFVQPQVAETGQDSELVDKIMQIMIEIRQHCRANKDFATADLIRDRLKTEGVVLEDRPGGTGWTLES